MTANTIQNIPDELRSYPQWTCRKGKIPIDPHTGGKAKVNDPFTWGTFEQACDAVSKGTGDGIGYMLAATCPFACIDLDDTHGDETLLAVHKKIQKTFDSWTELSLSGNGVHIWIKGDVTGGIKQSQSHKVDLFSANHFVAVTGKVYHDVPIAERQALLTTLESEVTPAREAVYDAGTNAQPMQQLSDDTIIERIKVSPANWDNYEGRVSDWSAAYFALICAVCLFSSDEAQVRRVVMASPLVQDAPPKAGKTRLQKAQRLWAKEYASAARKGAQERQSRAVGAEHGRQMVQGMTVNGKPIRVATTPDEAIPTGLIIRSMAEVTMTAIEYVWKGWVPKGYLTLIAGETGAAKTTVVADIAARISTGAPWPNETEQRVPARVLWLGSEDGMEDMTVPRLNACHANLHNIIEIQGVNRDGLRNTFSLQDDIQNVATLLQGAIEVGDPFGAIVIDPITSYLSGSRQREVKMNDAGQLRSVLEPWLSLAQKFEIAIICITHLAKDTNRTMLHRVLGSAAFAQTCRSLIAVVDRKTDDQPWAKAMAQVKMNLPDHPGGSWLFETKKVDVGTDPRTGKAISATKPEWEFLDPLIDVNNLVASSGTKSERNLGFALWVSQYFRNVQSDEGVPVSDVKDAAVQAAIVSKKQWERISPQYLEKRNITGIWYCRPKETMG